MTQEPATTSPDVQVWGWPTSEAEMCAALVKHFRALPPPHKVDVHQEVQPQTGHSKQIDGRVDIVLVKASDAPPDGCDVTAIECKMSLNADVIAQAKMRKKYAHFVRIYVPKPSETVRNSRGHKLLITTCSIEGIGVGYASLRYGSAGERPHFEKAEGSCVPRRNPKAMVDLLTFGLCNATREFNKAGSSGRVRQFNAKQDRFDKVRAWAKANPGGELKRMKQEEKLSKEEHLEIKRALERGEVAGVSIETVAGRITLIPAGTEDEGVHTNGGAACS